ncbi:Protein tyrosine phosphatase [Spironucleus salmonicida]|uniref:Protein tyrosine phosphatase n=1 Tax=Spironucleus salmonicida TaxID=348837 RepID=V6LWV5_9EUKA|nr:Protein tyrosine phosphatase [Spironucleus salmonicida]|eukprot:EST49070.1 Protein tyrosine phosphatase [Spironucleus salmonicida]
MNKSPLNRLRLPALLPDKFPLPELSPRSLLKPQYPRPSPTSKDEFLLLFDTYMHTLQKNRQNLIQSNPKERYPELSVYESTLPYGNLYNDIIVGCAPKSFNNFVETISENSPDVILMLTKFTENNIQKAQRWWPLAENEPKWIEDQALLYEKMEICKKESKKPVFGVEKDFEICEEDVFWSGEKININNNIITSNFISDVENEEFRYNIKINEKNILLHALLTWDDFTIIPLQKMYDLTCQFLNKKLLVHCSAGIGRAATFAACFEILREKRSGKLIQNWNRRVYEIVDELRVSRSPQAVQNREQFGYLFDFQAFVDGQELVE